MKAKAVWIVNSVLFVVMMVVGGIAFWVMPQKTVSEDEKRELKKQPVMTQESVLSGKYEKDFEEFYNDHFPLRDGWIGFANVLNSYKGKQNQEFRVIETPAQPAAPVATANNTNTQESQAEQPTQEEQILNEEFTKVRGVVVVNGRVVQNFGGSKATLTPFVNLVHEYQSKLGADVKTYVMPIPTGGDYYLPHQVNQGEKRELQNIELMKTMLNPDVIVVPSYEELAKHKDEYIMFRTDHHWTGLGAYYAYRAFAQSAGFRPLELSEMTYVKSDKTFLGSMFSYTKDQELKKNPDVLEYYKVPNEHTVTIHKNGKQIPGALYVEYANNYGVFLGGDWALTHIKTNNNSGRKILLIKDSFGNAFATYLAAHYDDIYVVDYRYFKQSIPAFMAEHGVKEFLYAHNTFAMNSQAAVKYGKTMLVGQ